MYHVSRRQRAKSSRIRFGHLGPQAPGGAVGARQDDVGPLSTAAHALLAGAMALEGVELVRVPRGDLRALAPGFVELAVVSVHVVAAGLVEQRLDEGAYPEHARRGVLEVDGAVGADAEADQAA